MAAWGDGADRRAAATMAGIMPKPVPVQPSRGLYEIIAALSLRWDIRPGSPKPGAFCPPSPSSPQPTWSRSATSDLWRQTVTNGSGAYPAGFSRKEPLLSRPSRYGVGRLLCAVAAWSGGSGRGVSGLSGSAVVLLSGWSG